MGCPLTCSYKEYASTHLIPESASLVVVVVLERGVAWEGEGAS